MSADLAAMLVATVTVGVSLAGLNLALWRSVRADLRAVDTDLRADIRALRALIDADRVAHKAMHVAERQAWADDKRELSTAIGPGHDTTSEEDPHRDG